MKLLISILLFALAVSCFADGLPMVDVEVNTGSSFVGYVPNRIVVTFDREIVKQFNAELLKQGRTGVAEIDQVGERLRANTIRRLFSNVTPRSYQGRSIELALFYQVFFEHEVDVEQAVASFNALGSVIKAEPVGIHETHASPNDPQFDMQWHLDQANDADVDAPEAWDLETGDPSIIVAVLDTGVRYYHKDLGGSAAAFNDFSNVNGNMWINWAEKNGVPGVDDDGNGYVDDWIGYDFIDGGTFAHPDEDSNTPDNDPRDFNGHGTHCAGNVGTLNNNGYGICSVSGGWGDGTFQPTGNGVKVMAMRCGYASVGNFTGFVQMDAAAQCLVYAAENGARIASCSWGSSDTGGLGAAVDQFLAAGGLIFKAAGNAGDENTDYMTARNDIIAVAATDENDNAADFTSYGTWVDISAPGNNIVSTGHNYEDDANDYISTMSGTSMACPIAASVAALIWSRHPDWTAAQVKQQLFDTADDIEDKLSATYKGKMGVGRVNAFEAVNDSPIDVTLASFHAVRQYDGSVALNWRTESEQNTAGFFVQRSMLQHDGFVRIHAQMLPAAGNSETGAVYDINDPDYSGAMCYYRLEEITLDGTSSYWKAVQVSSLTSSQEKHQIPFTFNLQQNYPNPFNPSTEIEYSIPDVGYVELSVYDMNGRLVKTLVATNHHAGYYTVLWDGRDASGSRVASGAYICRLQAGDKLANRKMVLLQ